MRYALLTLPEFRIRIYIITLIFYISMGGGFIHNKIIIEKERKQKNAPTAGPGALRFSWGGLMAEFKWIWQYVKKYRLMFGAAFILVVLMTALNMVNPYITGQIVDRVIKGNETGLLTRLAGIMLAVTVIRALVRYVYQNMFEYVSQGITFNIREQIYIRLQELDFGFFDKTKTGEIMSRMTGDLEAVRHFSSFVIYQVALNALTFITVSAILFTMNFRLAVSLLLISPVIGFFTFRMAKYVKPAFAEIREQFARLNSVVQENISGNRVVKAFAKEPYEIEKFSRENRAFMDRNMDAAKGWEKFIPILDATAGTLSILIILVGGIQVINGNLTVGELVAFNGYLWALNTPMRMAGWLLNDVQRFAASAEKIMLLLKREPVIRNSGCAVSKERLDGSIEFRDVSFRYEDEEVLDGISFKAEPGQTIAVVGPTGSGKSSLVSLICRFYDCTSGEVLVDGTNIKNIDLKSLRRNISTAMQDIFLFSDTIEGNISYGVPEAPLEQVVWAAEAAEAGDFIQGFSEGYDTIIGERGVGLSGGQRQRIALARALLKDPSVLILDDTTSSVDIETEHEIQKRLGTLNRERTTFIIAHRISSVKNADLILVLNEGRIIERGRHQELLDKKGYYYGIFMNQYGDFDRKGCA